jgi:hypothetical protein
MAGIASQTRSRPMKRRSGGVLSPAAVEPSSVSSWSLSPSSSTPMAATFVRVSDIEPDTDSRVAAS